MMELFVSLKYLLFVAHFIGTTHANSAEQGFFIVVNGPQLGRKSQDTLYLYALHSIIQPGFTENVFEKQGGLLTQYVDTGRIPATETPQLGAFLSIGATTRYRGTRYGAYKVKLVPDSQNLGTRTGFVKPKSDLLDTRGVYTRTVWPAVSGGTGLASSPENNIGVRWSPGCRSIQWCKGKKRNVNTGPRLQLTSTDDAGVYTISRGKRRASGWFVQIEVIASTCQFSEYLNGQSCDGRTVTSCKNGGVPRDAVDECLCPPFFSGDDCSEEVNQPAGKARDFVLASPGGNLAIRCGEHLPGGNPECRGYLFCYGDLYGCKCASGWWGNNCDQPCQKGKWGVDCSQNCPNNQDCDRIFGP
ncbi:uncharacterized protein [Apostichopus japonicus]|uniref:uncharacterized protein isoform X2 n=1 Tax=Stichopus japonicus TaxID=307972 RepID=UPI003AB5878B